MDFFPVPSNVVYEYNTLPNQPLNLPIETVFVAEANSEAFHYWHVTEGALFFGMIGVAIFGLFYGFLLKQDESENQEEAESISDDSLETTANSFPSTHLGRRPLRFGRGHPGSSRRQTRSRG